METRPARHNKRALSARRYGFRRKLAIATSTIAAGTLALTVAIVPNLNRVASALTISSVTVSQGATAGMNQVTVHGSGFMKKTGDKVVQVSRNFLLTKDGQLFMAPVVGNKYYDFKNAVDVTDKVGVTKGEKIAQISETSRKLGYVGVMTDAGHLSIIQNTSNVANLNYISINKDFGTNAKLFDNYVVTSNGEAYQVYDDGGLYNATSRYQIDAGDKIVKASNYYMLTEKGQVATPYDQFYNNIADISVGDRYRMMVDKNGVVYTWGDGDYGRLGQGNLNDYDNPTQIPAAYFGDEKVVSVYASDCASFAITESGKLYAWGSNEGGQLGVNDNNYDHSYARPTLVSTNTSVLKDKKVISIYNDGDASDLTTVATDDGNVYTWGQSWGDQCVQASVATAPGQPPQFAKLAAVNSSNNSATCYAPNDITDWIKVNVTETPNVKMLTFGGFSAVSFKVVDDNTITAVVPAHPAGRVDVDITSNDGDSTKLEKGYEYVDEGDGNNESNKTNGDKNIVPSAPNTGSRE